MRLLFAGTPAVAVPSLDKLIGSEQHDVAAVLTRPDRPAGRGRHVASSPVKERAIAAGIEVLQPTKLSQPEFVDRLNELAVDCCPVVAYGGLIPESALDIPQRGWVNLHFSLLPAWRGAAPVQRAILAGDDVTGATTFELEASLDTGPVYGMLTMEIRPDDTAGTLLDRLAVAGSDLLVATLDGIEDGSLQPRPQPEDGVSLAPKVSVDDGHVDWTAPALRVDRLVRACTPAPGAWSTFRGRRVKIGPVRASDTVLPAGVVDAATGSVLVGTGSTAVALGEVRPEGKAAMWSEAWARGMRLQPGERFG